MADAALQRRVTRTELESLTLRMRQWPGIVGARKVVAEADRRAESPLESLVRGRCVLLDLPRPALQVWVDDRARVDFLWERHRVVGEADGRVKYDGDALWREKQRQERLENRYVVIRWTWQQANDPDELFRARLLAALARGERLRAMSGG